MDNFNTYAEYYNLLYKDKDYKAEADYIDSLIKKFSSSSASVLDLGCGTGRHAYELYKMGYSVTGIDMSTNMLKMTDNLPENNIEFHLGDVRNIDLQKQYDVVISLFHVLSYQQTNADVLAMLNTVNKHLKNNGIFIVDCWYGPGVMNDRPTIRRKELENENIKIDRLAEPVMHFDKNIVDVNYTLNVEEKSTGNRSEIKETHSMRYFFNPEILLLAQCASFEVLLAQEWLSGNELNEMTWNAVYICRKVEKAD